MASEASRARTITTRSPGPAWTDHVGCHLDAANGFQFLVERLHREQLDTFEVLIFEGADRVSEDTAE
jgi:hypothetical protein